MLGLLSSWLPTGPFDASALRRSIAWLWIPISAVPLAACLALAEGNSWWEIAASGLLTVLGAYGIAGVLINLVAWNRTHTHSYAWLFHSKLAAGLSLVVGVLMIWSAVQIIEKGEGDYSAAPPVTPATELAARKAVDDALTAREEEAAAVRSGAQPTNQNAEASPVAPMQPPDLTEKSDPIPEIRLEHLRVSPYPERASTAVAVSIVNQTKAAVIVNQIAVVVAGLDLPVDLLRELCQRGCPMSAEENAPVTLTIGGTLTISKEDDPAASPSVAGEADVEGGAEDGARIPIKGEIIGAAEDARLSLLVTVELPIEPQDVQAVRLMFPESLQLVAPQLNRFEVVPVRLPPENGTISIGAAIGGQPPATLVRTFGNPADRPRANQSSPYPPPIPGQGKKPPTTFVLPEPSLRLPGSRSHPGGDQGPRIPGAGG
jgi:hypothetical protein